MSPALDHIPMTWYYLLEVPPVDPSRTLIEPLSIRRTCHVPQEPLLPRRRTNRVLETREKPRQKSVRRLHA